MPEATLHASSEALGLERRGDNSWVAAGGPGKTAMSRDDWTTISIPKTIYEEVRTHHVPDRAPSVAAYALFAIRLMSLIDRALTTTKNPEELTARIIEALRDRQG